MAEGDDKKLRARFGRRCREVRRKRGLSQMDLVRRFEFSLSHYQKIERGDLDPRLSTVKRIAKAFGVSMAELLDGL